MTLASLVSAHWLHDSLSATDVKVIDASWYLPAAQRNTQAEYLAGHIPSAVFFDIDACATPSDLPHMLPSPEVFAEYVGDMGISHADRVVVYDSHGLFSAARVWWMLRLFGCQQVAVLNGGLGAWQGAGYALATGAEQTGTTNFVCQPDMTRVVNAEYVLAALQEQDVAVLDARPNARFMAVEKEARPGLRSGHMPGAYSMPFMNLQHDGALLPVDQLKQVLGDYLHQREIITTCGSGVTAAVIYLALSVCGYDKAKLYDGSWTEWGGREDLPLAP